MLTITLTKPVTVKKLFCLAILLFACFVSYGQGKLVSYDDLGYLLRNNINNADSFFVAKGYTLIEKNVKKNTRKYTLALPGSVYNNINVRVDGRRMYLEMDTNDIQQYNLINNSIADYLNKATSTADILNYTVKDLGNIYIMVNDAVPYDPIKRVYTIQIVSEKGITAYN